MCLVGRWRSTASCHCSERLRACPPAGFRRRLFYARSLGDEVVVEALPVFGSDSCGLSDEVALLGVRRREVQLGGGRGAEVSEIIGGGLPALRDARVSDEGPRNAPARAWSLSARASVRLDRHAASSWSSCQVFQVHESKPVSRGRGGKRKAGADRPLLPPAAFESGRTWWTWRAL